MSDISEDSKTVKIVNPERVERILTRVFNAHLEVLVRATNSPKIAVRGRAHIASFEAGLSYLLINQISEKGLGYLSNLSDLRIEFVGMSTQIVFFTRKLSIAKDSITVAVPSELLSFDRRENMRHNITANASSFIKFSGWNPVENDLRSPPIVPIFPKAASLIAVSDFSEGGLCCSTRFPGVLGFAEKGLIDNEAQLILPMQVPITMPMEVRWVRHVKEEKSTQGVAKLGTTFRIGLQFKDVEEGVKLTLMQYIQQLSVSDAI